MLKLVNITKNFGDIKALSSINLEVSKGERLVIIGPSGCGKSTLLRCINALEIPTSGKILFKDENIKDIPSNILRQKIGMVFQELNLFNHLTVMENITLAPMKLKLMSKEEALEKGRTLLENVKLKYKENQYPDNLSGGEAQRVAIVRSLMLSPEILLFDEPTSALDPKTNDEVLKLMKDIADQGMTMVIVTHNMSFAKEIASRIIFMDKGRIIEEGLPNEIFDHPKSDELKRFLNK